MSPECLHGVAAFYVKFQLDFLALSCTMRVEVSIHVGFCYPAVRHLDFHEPKHLFHRSPLRCLCR